MNRWGEGAHCLYIAKTPVNMSLYSADETFEWSRPFPFCSEHRIVDKQQE